MDFRDFLRENKLYLDGGMGTLLQAAGLCPGELPERWNLTHPDTVRDIHTAYFNSGSNLVCTNTFGANSLKFSDEELSEIITAAVTLAKEARAKSTNPAPKFVALDIGPSGKLLAPLGDLDFEEAVAVFAKTVKIGAALGVDLIIIETMNDSYETKAALLAAKENSDLPVIVTNAYGEDGKLMTGASPEAMVALLEGMGVTALGANCSLGPAALLPVAKRLCSAASVPVVLKPNAGLPSVVDGRTVFDVSPSQFAEELVSAFNLGIRAAGGCCGTTPDYIKALFERTHKLTPLPVTAKNKTVVSSYTHAVEFGERPLLIGERINPTGKKRFKQALLERDIDYILGEGVSQQEKGVDILDVNVGLPDIDETEMLKTVAAELQTVSNLPLQLDTANPAALEAALRRYNGKALINSVNGKRESIEVVFPLVKKYGGVVVALTLDERGIPETAEERVSIARKILAAAAEYGIEPKDIVFDTLAMTVSADNTSAKTTLGALRTIKNELGCHTSLGVSNVSFGLPSRDAVNSTFFALALGQGLSAAIMNPYSADMMKTYYSYLALSGLDENCAQYIKNADRFATVAAAPVVGVQAKNDSDGLEGAICHGLCERAAALTAELLKTAEPLAVVNNDIIPALNRQGAAFEEKRIYLPQLLQSAEAAKAAFEVIKTAMPSGESSTKATFVIATVKGDIHDIGKNIVKLLLQNYGYKVIDLGRDVAPEKVLEAVQESGAPLVGLSALMTTTVGAMEETIALLREKAPKVKIVVGGAVLTEDYAMKIGADKYAKDAMEAVRYAESISEELK